MKKKNLFKYVENAKGLNRDIKGTHGDGEEGAGQV